MSNRILDGERGGDGDGEGKDQGKRKAQYKRTGDCQPTKRGKFGITPPNDENELAVIIREVIERLIRLGSIGAQATINAARAMTANPVHSSGILGFLCSQRPLTKDLLDAASELLRAGVSPNVAHPATGRTAAMELAQSSLGASSDEQSRMQQMLQLLLASGGVFSPCDRMGGCAYTASLDPRGHGTELTCSFRNRIVIENVVIRNMVASHFIRVTQIVDRVLLPYLYNQDVVGRVV